MIKKALLSACLAVALQAAVIVESPQNATISVNLSNSSVNRIVLPEDIKDLAFSQEKNAAITVKGNQAFIKFNPTKRSYYKRPAGAQGAPAKGAKPDRTEIVYDASESVDVYFITADRTYSFNLIPKSNYKPQTIIVNDFAKSVQDTIKYETENSYVKTLSKLTQTILNNGSPSGYKVKEVDKVVDQKFDLTTKLLSSYEGVLYGAYLFEVNNSTSVKRQIDITKFFDYVKEKPLAISVFYDNEYNELLPHDSARVVYIFKVTQ